MAYNNLIVTSIYGRRLGLQKLSSSASGGANGFQEFLVGPADLRVGVTTADTTSQNLRSHGMSILPASSVGSSQVFTMDPPIPGLYKTIANSTSATAFIKVSPALIQSTVGSTQQVIQLPAAGASITLMAVTTALWLAQVSTASGVGIQATT